MDIKKKKVCVVIPIYKEKLEYAELICFENNIHRLQSHDIFIICPYKLNIEFYQKYTNLQYKRFHDDYFTSIQGYSKLMVDCKFYQEFMDYEYMLICQVDAFVFKDELEYWCNCEYDYIGAPWLTLMTDPIYGQLCGKVGNGGFSLRRIETCYNFTKDNQERLLNEVESGEAEDVLFGFAKDFKIPNVQEAANFSFELNGATCMQYTNNKMPFGSHKLYMYEPYLFNFFFMIQLQL